MIHPVDVPTVSVAELSSDSATLLDVREDDEWAAGHAPNAVHIPLGELPARVAELAELPDNKPIYVVCRTGGRSGRAARWLNSSGWDAVNVAGGMKSWVIENRPLVSEGEHEPEIL